MSFHFPGARAVLVAACLLPFSGTASAQDPPGRAPQAEASHGESHAGSDGAGEGHGAEAAHGGDGKHAPKTIPHGDDLASILVLLLGGIVMLALLAFATIVLWGRRVRRALRASPAKTKLQDELWYLKPKAGLPPDEPPEDAS